MRACFHYFFVLKVLLYVKMKNKNIRDKYNYLIVLNARDTVLNHALILECNIIYIFI